MLSRDVIEQAAVGRVHRSFIDLERPDMANARELIRALAAEIKRLQGTDKPARSPYDVAVELERLKELADTTPDGQPDGSSETNAAFYDFVDEHFATIITALKKV